MLHFPSLSYTHRYTHVVNFKFLSDMGIASPLCFLLNKSLFSLSRLLRIKFSAACSCEGILKGAKTRGQNLEIKVTRMSNKMANNQKQ